MTGLEEDMEADRLAREKFKGHKIGSGKIVGITSRKPSSIVAAFFDRKTQRSKPRPQFDGSRNGNGN